MVGWLVGTLVGLQRLRLDIQSTNHRSARLDLEVWEKHLCPDAEGFPNDHSPDEALYDFSPRPPHPSPPTGPI